VIGCISKYVHKPCIYCQPFVSDMEVVQPTNFVTGIQLQGNLSTLICFQF